MSLDLNREKRPTVLVLAERDAEAAHFSDYLLLLGIGTLSCALMALGIMKLFETL